jgi:DNA-binding response OmpR family regulator
MIILVAEDNALLAFMIESAILEHGYTVLGPASRADEALALARRTRPTLAIIDIDLEGEVSGVELARQLRDQLSVPTMFATGQLALARANADAAFGLIAKPFSPVALGQAVEAAGQMLRGEPRGAFPPEFELL